jgi:flagellar hook-associated protein 3 FlgL
MRVSTSNFYTAGNLAINADQSALMNTQAELSSGKQINSPMDNPVGAAQASMLQSDLAQLGQYAGNQAQATQLLNTGASTLTQAINLLQSAHTTLIQAGNGSLSDSDRNALAAQLQQNLAQLVGLANTSDGQGGYLFGGSYAGGPPFVQNGNSVSYQGDGIAQSLQISQTRSETVRYPGAGVFMSVPSGNGSFVTAAAAGNSGSGAIDAGIVSNPSALTGDNYSITVNAAGTGFTVQDLTRGTTVNSGTLGNPVSIGFDGLQVQLSGVPAAGDSFTIAPSTNQSVFSGIAAAIAALQSSGATASAASRRSAALTQALDSTSQASSSLSSAQSTMGAQLQELSAFGTENSDQKLQTQTQLSSVVDLNYAQAVSQLSQQQTQFQAALQSYSAVSKLSLFSYL